MTYTVLFHFSLFFSRLQFPFHIKHSIFLAFLLDGPAFQGISPFAVTQQLFPGSSALVLGMLHRAVFLPLSGFFLCSHFFLGHLFVKEYRRTLDLSANEHVSSLPIGLAIWLGSQIFSKVDICIKQVLHLYVGDVNPSTNCPLCPALSVGLHWRRSGVGSLSLTSTFLLRKCSQTFCCSTDTIAVSSAAFLTVVKLKDFLLLCFF